jgi:hypothetical protein
LEDWLGEDVRAAVEAWIAYLGIPAWVVLLVLGALVAVWRLHAHHIKLLEKMGEPGKREEIDKARSRPLVAVDSYRRRLAAVLGWLDARLGPHPWGPGSYDWCLRLAFVYPILGILLIWAITGENTSGIPDLLPALTTATTLGTPLTDAP